MRLPKTLRSAKLSWPSHETVNTVLACLALAVSAAGLPILTQFYFHPDLLVASAERTSDQKRMFASYRITNAGRAPATKIEIGFLVAPQQKLRLTPAIAANIVEEEHGMWKFVRVEVERLSPRESFTVTISGAAGQIAKIEPPFKGLSGLPSFSFVRSAEGPGRYAPAPGEKAYWLYKGILN